MTALYPFTRSIYKTNMTVTIYETGVKVWKEDDSVVCFYVPKHDMLFVNPSSPTNIYLVTRINPKFAGITRMFDKFSKVPTVEQFNLELTYYTSDTFTTIELTP